MNTPATLEQRQRAAVVVFEGVKLRDQAVEALTRWCESGEFAHGFDAYVFGHTLERRLELTAQALADEAAAQRPPLRNVAVADTGDVDSVCSVCGGATEEPHANQQCFEHAAIGIDALSDARARIMELEAELTHVNADLHARAGDISGIRVELVDRLRADLNATKSQLKRVIVATKPVCVAAVVARGIDGEGRFSDIWEELEAVRLLLKEIGEVSSG